MGHALARQDTALAAAAAALGAAAQGFLELVDAAGPRTPRYQVFVDADSYVICDPIGVPLPSVAPLPLDSPHAAERLIERLLRIRRFHCLAELTAPASSLEAQVRVELHRAPAGWRPGDSRTVTDGPLVDPIRVDTDSVLILRVVNGGAQAINFACLDLQCDWAIEPLVPAEDWGEYEVVPANESRDFPLRMYVPPGFAATSDVFMAFVTVADVRFSWIRQPALDRPLERGTHGAARGAARSPAGGLEAIFAAVDAPGHLRLRSADLIASDTAWMVKRLSVTVERAAATADRPHGGAPKAT